MRGSLFLGKIPKWDLSYKIQFQKQFGGGLHFFIFLHFSSPWPTTHRRRAPDSERRELHRGSKDRLSKERGARMARIKRMRPRAGGKRPCLRPASTTVHRHANRQSPLTVGTSSSSPSSRLALTCLRHGARAANPHGRALSSPPATNASARGTAGASLFQSSKSVAPLSVTPLHAAGETRDAAAAGTTTPSAAV